MAVGLPLGSMYHVVDQIGARDAVAAGHRRVRHQRGGDRHRRSRRSRHCDGSKIVAVVDLSAEAGVARGPCSSTRSATAPTWPASSAARPPAPMPPQAADHPEWFMGVAPDAGIVSVKVADNIGRRDITQVIAGVDWVTDHAAELNIKVLNLSYSSGSTLPYAPIRSPTPSSVPGGRHRRRRGSGNDGRGFGV